MAGIQRGAMVLSLVAYLVALSLLAGCSSQARPPGLQPSEIADITVWVRDKNWYLEQRRVVNSDDQFDIEQFVEAWATLETLRPPSNLESPDGAIEIDVSLTEGRHWKLMWLPDYGEAVFKLIGSGTSEMVERSGMKLQSDDMVRLLQDWLAS